MRFQKLMLISLSTFSTFTLLLSCVNKPDVIPLAPGLYMLTEEDMGPFATLSRLKAETFQKANAFAAAQGKIAISVEQKEYPRSFGQFPHFEYKFRLVDKDSSEARQYLSDSDHEAAKNAIPPPNENNKDELAIQLKNLEKMHKDGLISEEEYKQLRQRAIEKEK